jgi:hypothetical protein
LRCGTKHGSVRCLLALDSCHALRCKHQFASCHRTDAMHSDMQVYLRMMAWIWRTVAEMSDCLSPFGRCSWGDTMTIPVCKRYRCGGLVGLRVSGQWQATVLVVGHDHECHNCHLVEHSIATHPTDGETAPMTLTTSAPYHPHGSTRRCHRQLSAAGAAA